MRLVRLLAVLSLTVALAGCGGDSGPSAAPSAATSAGASAAASPPSPVPESGKPSDGSSAAPPVVTADGEQTGGSQLGPVTGTRTVTGSAKAAGGPVRARVDIHGLHRDGRLLRLNFSITNLAAERFFVPDLIPLLGTGNLYLIDTAGLKKYLVVVGDDPAKSPVFTRPSLYLAAGQTFEGTAYFAQPPASVTELDLRFDDVGSFRTPIVA